MSDTGSFALIAIMVILVISLRVAHVRFLRRDGEIRRGFTVATETLPSEMIPFVHSLVDGYSHKQHAAFILRSGSAVLVQPVQYRLRKDPRLPFVGFIDLNTEPHVIEYRLSTCEMIVLIPPLAFLFAVPWIDYLGPICALGFDLFIVAYFGVAYVTGKSRVLSYIESSSQTKGE